MAYAYPSGSFGGQSSGYERPVGPSSISGDTDSRSDVLREFKHLLDEEDHYLLFFQDRIKIEQQYIESLGRLYTKSVAVDSLHDDVNPRTSRASTARRAWIEVREYTQREMQAREAMVGALKEDVVRILMNLRDEQTRIRGALRDNMKLAHETYDDHAKTQLPKIKKTYYQKCQALEDHKRQEHAIAMRAQLLSTPSPPSPASTPLQEHPFAVPAGPTYTSPPISNPPLPPQSNPAAQPLGLADTPAFIPEHGHRASIPFSPTKEDKKLSGRLRAGSASGGENKGKDVLNDIAAQSKKGFSVIMQKLGGDRDKDRESGESGLMLPASDSEVGLQRHGTASGTNQKALSAMKGVKAKREADEADKAYRAAVFHLESLRLRQEKLHYSAVASLETFNDELSDRLRTALESYVDVVHCTAATNAQATEVARAAIQRINPEQDIMLFRSRLRTVHPPPIIPVPYDNFYVGPCRSLIFGVSLTDYDHARGQGGDHGRPPTIVEKAIQTIDERGLEVEGIYRVSGRHASVQKMVQDIELDEERFTFDDKDDIYGVGNVLKQYLRQLPEPLFPFPHAERIRFTEERESHIESNFSTLRARLQRLPFIHQTTFQAVVEHLGRVHQHSTVNKMAAKNLAVLFNSVIFGQDQLPSDGSTLLTHYKGNDTVLEDLITFSDLLFRVESPTLVPSAAPPGPALSRSGVLTRESADDKLRAGSSRTKITLSAAGTDDHSHQRAPPYDGAVSSHSLANVSTDPSESPFTPDDELELLFDPSLIPTSLRQQLPDGVHVRPLASTDLLRSHFILLSDLRASPALAPSVYASIFAGLKSCPSTYYILVIVDKLTDELVASGTVISEKKFINKGGIAGHIEDIVISERMQGRRLGQKLVVGLRDMAVALGCYKVILDCKEDKVPFYEKCGFSRRSVGMAFYV
ncbi:hypothetical protein IAU60_006179 [Kwoniella sp. DSM 27419]